MAECDVRRQDVKDWATALDALTEHGTRSVVVMPSGKVYDTNLKKILDTENVTALYRVDL